MLHRCCYPSCVGQSTSWVFSPLGYNTLLAYLEHSNDRVKKYAATHNLLKDNKLCTVKNKLFISPANNSNKNKISDADLEKSELDFKNTKQAASIISQWANRGANFKEFDIANYVPSNTTFCLVNLCVFKGVWQAASSAGRRMKVHNSFAYTQDINYEPRILELPLEDENFRLVVFVPNGVDLLHTLFRRLTNEGLTASFASVQPLFTAPSILKPPNIKITSDTDISLEEGNKNINQKVIQHGNVTVDGNGATINVLTCLYRSNEQVSCKTDTKPTEKSPFFFAIVFKDTPIFTGQYTEEMF